MPRWLRASSRSWEFLLDALGGNGKWSSRITPALTQPFTGTYHKPELFHQAKLQQRFKGGRYEILGRLGDGVYSTVWLAKDLNFHKHVALKILRADCYGGDHDIFELEILQKLAETCVHSLNPGKAHVIKIQDHFQHTGEHGDHVCIVSPLLGYNIRQLAGVFHDGRIPVDMSKHITRQILQALDYVHTECGIIHTDLQPNNICLELENSESAAESSLIEAEKNPDDPSDPPLVTLATPTSKMALPPPLQVIDFGVASWIDKRLTNIIQPEHLRAPEAIIHAPWGSAVDIWSLGCLVIEYVKGHVAFPGKADRHGRWTSEDDHLAQQMEILGYMPEALLRCGTKTAEYFDTRGNLSRIPKLEMTNLAEVIDGTGLPFARPTDMPQDEVPVFLDFLRGALALDPAKRKTAAELLRHPWLAA